MNNVMKLIKLTSSHQNLRTDEIYGQALGLPELGKSFHFIGEALDPKAKALGASRLITTSVITEVLKDGNTFEFRTKNSHYRLEVVMN